MSPRAALGRPAATWRRSSGPRPRAHTAKRHVSHASQSRSLGKTSDCGFGPARRLLGSE